MHLNLLRIWRRAKLGNSSKVRVYSAKWEQTLAEFCLEHAAPKAAQELQDLGYQNASLATRLAAFARLLESMLVYCPEVKEKFDQLAGEDINGGRHAGLLPLGSAMSGARYWLQVDQGLNFRLYREERGQLVDGEEVSSSWKMIAK